MPPSPSMPMSRAGIGVSPRLFVPVELSNIASSMLQLSDQGHGLTGGQGGQGHQSPIDEGVGRETYIQQSQQIYRDAIRSVQEQIRLSSRQHHALVRQEFEQCSGRPTFSTPPHNDDNSPDDMSSSPFHTPPKTTRRSILSNPHDDIWSSVPELSKARQMLDEARRAIRLNKKVAVRESHQPASLQTTNRPGSATEPGSSSAGSASNDVEKMMSVATIGMHQHPLILPTCTSSSLVTPYNSPKPTTSSHPFNSSAHYVRYSKMLEYISAIMLYNYALTYHLYAIHTNDLAVLAKSANLYDMCVKVLHAELDDILKDYTAYNNGLQESSGDANGKALGTVTGTCSDPILSNLQQLARTAMGAALTNAGLIYHAFGEHNDAMALFNVLLQLCDVESRRRHRRRRRDSHRREQEQPVGAAHADTNVHVGLPSSEAVGATIHEDFTTTSQTEDGPWDHFFCAALALRAGTIAPCA